MSTTKQRLSTPGVIGWPFLLGAFAIFVIDGFPFLGGADLNVSGFAQAGLIVQAAAFAQIPLAVVLLTGRLTWLRLGVARRHPAVMVITIFIATLLADAVFQGVLTSGRNDGYVGATLIENVLYKTIALCILALALIDLDDYRTRLRSLEENRASLLTARHDADASRRAERQRVDETLAGPFTRATEALAADNLHAASRTLQDLSSTVVRPLSHDLVADTSSLALGSPTPLPQPSRRASLRRLAATPLITPRLMAVVMVTLGFRQTVESAPGQPSAGTSVSITFDAQLFLESISVLFVIGIATWLAAHGVRRVLTGSLTGFTTVQQWWANTAGVVTIALITLVVVGASFALPWFPDPPRLHWWTPLVTIIPLMVIALGHGLFRALDEHRALITAQLTAAVDDLRHELTTLTTQIWHHRRHLAQAVHGGVQAEFTAAALRLAAVADSAPTDPTRRTTIDDVRGRLQAVAAALRDDTPTAVDVIRSIEETRALWSAVCTIALRADGNAVRRLNTSAATATAAGVLIAEACANAISHGGASEIRIEIAAVDARAVVVRISDNGSGVLTTAEPGVGSQFLDEVSLMWSLTPAADGTGSLLEVHLAA
jgi:signal transduction histidine kinase